ncbi:tryptophan--tRNA ligase, chloroplastic/mitochondrial isoform X2 [Telopea speciosissima]|uniref:tryptophan--tRNA ligase, chloroplastic/mitochondrial isoform X2 n=1 Tax=Telopea speciosissima TaxID=54955 RepID=UPI001CC7BEA2|nr:tryptophan--tRNA ligase, chloroplastic/mitochondrial isoform X2 [Telopea speciosissima]
MGTSVLSHVISVSIASPFFLRSMSSGRLQRSYLKRWGRMHHYCLPSGYIDTSRRYCSVSVSQSDASETASTSVKKRVVSGVQPTGSIHLGNYLGAIKNWISLQITLEHDVKQLATSTKSTAAIYMACGVDTTKASVFVQSHVRAHAELMWLLSSVTPIGWLNRMIQFKEKSRKAGDEQVGVALLTYPVLMASDILLYQSDLVPVGEDQKQHLELTRELAERVNYIYGRKWKKMGGRSSAIFKVPESLIPPAGARVMSLTDGLSKMSKSDPSDQSRINLLDPKDVIANKIKRCKTDSFSGLEFDNPDRPECHNLLSIYQLITGRTKEEVSRECQDMNWGTFKTLLTDSLVDHLHPIQVRYEEIMSDSAYLDSVLAEGATKAAVVADATLNNVYQAMGFSRR